MVVCIENPAEVIYFLTCHVLLRGSVSAQRLGRWTCDQPVATTSGSDRGQAVRIHLCLSQSSEIWYWREGGWDCRSGVARHMRHLLARGLRTGDELPQSFLTGINLAFATFIFLTNYTPHKRGPNSQ